MATRKKRRSKNKRPVEQYISSARELSQYAPSLKKYKNRKRLKPHEKAAIARKEKLLKGVDSLFPVTKKQARKLRGKLFAPGIRAVRFRGVDPATARLRINKKGDITFKDQNNYEWVYWAIDRETARSKRGMKRTAQAAFEKQFPIEIAKELARTAFKKFPVQGVALWTHAGRSSAVFDDFRAFELWVNEKWSAGRYLRTDEYGDLKDASDPGMWVSGIAILLENPEYTAKRKRLKEGLPP